MKKIFGKLSGIRDNRESFTFLLIILVVYMFVVIPMLNERMVGKLTFMAFYYLFLTSGMHILDVKRKLPIYLIFIVAPLFVLVLQIILDSAWLTLALDIFVIVYFFWLGSILLMKTFSNGHITVNRVQGAVIVYLLSGFAFALIYHSIYLIAGPPAFKGLVSSRRMEFMYFSLTTLTTLGYGDLTPVNVYARSLTGLEALTGQLYPAILIARLVSMELTTKQVK
ncbi:MAG TPA: potassium channel family protein [Puia sp.]|nr:potassium channel family protein [Puia sp.]